MLVKLCQIGSLPQVWVKFENVRNHSLKPPPILHSKRMNVLVHMLRQLFERTKGTYSSSYIERASVILSPGSLEHLIRRGMDEVDLSIVHLYFNNTMGITCNISQQSPSAYDPSLIS